MDDKLYLVQELTEDNEVYISMKNSLEIIKLMDSLDYAPIMEVKVYDVSKFGEITLLKCHGVWHDFEDPLYIKITDLNNNTIFSGYGTDH